ncbi:MAG: HpcH/HpaI aldolase family protein [Clostridia bacterium]|jgi:4-hydroxy-2-oxoheptanedioate aldolase
MQKVTLRKSRVLEKLRAGKIASCFKTNLADYRTVQIAAMAGFDCIWTCLEHVPNDMETVEMQVLAAKAHDVDCVVRVARGSYSDYIRAFETDASGIMVPHVMSAEDARKVIQMTKFQPVGRRPLDGGNADGAFCMVSTEEYVKHSLREKFVILQIEDPEPLEELDAICSIEGVDMIFFGPGDFANTLGYPGQLTHPDVIKAWKMTADAAKRHGIFAGSVANPDIIDMVVDMGYQFINIGSDVGAIASFAGNMYKVIEKYM